MSVTMFVMPTKGIRPYFSDRPKREPVGEVEVMRGSDRC